MLIFIQYGKGYVRGKKGSELVGLTSDLLVNSSLFLIDEGRDLQDYAVIDGIMGLSSMETANDFIDLAYKAGYIEVIPNIYFYSSFIGENFLFSVRS